MQDFLSKMGETASDAANKAGNKANEIIEISKLRGKISSNRQEIAATKNEIGNCCYELFKDGKIENEEIKKFCEQIEGCENDISDMEQEIEDIKEEYKESKGRDIDEDISNGDIYEDKEDKD